MTSIDTSRVRATPYKLSGGEIIDSRHEVDPPHQDGYSAKEYGRQSMPQLQARLRRGPSFPHTSPLGYLLEHGTMYGFARRCQANVYTLNRGTSSFGIDKNHQYLQILPLTGLMNRQRNLMDKGTESQPDFNENSEVDQFDDLPVLDIHHKADHLDEGVSDMDNGDNQTGEGLSNVGDRDYGHTHYGHTSFCEDVKSDDGDLSADEGYLSDDPNYHELNIEPLPGSYQETLKATDTFSHQNRLSGVSAPNLQWPNGKTIVIKFLNGTGGDHKHVIKHAGVWLQGSRFNLKFKYVKQTSTEKSDVRIEFNDYGICNSAVGTAVVAGPHEATMKLSISERFPRAWVRWTIQHEFGHMLGLYHEHSSPHCTIEWKYEETYNFYNKACGWSREETKREVLNRHSIKEVEASAYDHQSVMHYPVNPYLTANCIDEIKYNEISEKDRDWLANMYPFYDSVGDGLSSPTLPAKPSPPRMGLVSYSETSQKVLQELFWLFLICLIFQIMFWIMFWGVR